MSVARRHHEHERPIVIIQKDTHLHKDLEKMVKALEQAAAANANRNVYRVHHDITGWGNYTRRDT